MSELTFRFKREYQTSFPQKRETDKISTTSVTQNNFTYWVKYQQILYNFYPITLISIDLYY